MRLLIVGGMLALAVSASLTPANAQVRGRPCYLSSYSSRFAFDQWPCDACTSHCAGGYRQCLQGTACSSGWMAEANACVAKCEAALSAFRTRVKGKVPVDPRKTLKGKVSVVHGFPGAGRREQPGASKHGSAIISAG
jgi:hypothetical protein